jgi:GNAT superfamily N-acetyltransferase
VSEIRIRPRRSSDLNGCVEALALVHRTDTYPTNWPEDPARWLAPAATLHGWVAVTAEQTVVGHVILQRAAADTPGVAYVSRLFVTPGARGADLGSRLLRQARDWAAARRLDLALEVVATEGSAAVALYERTGWQWVETVPAHWTAPDGAGLSLHRYALTGLASNAHRVEGVGDGLELAGPDLGRVRTAHGLCGEGDAPAAVGEQ